MSPKQALFSPRELSADMKQLMQVLNEEPDMACVLIGAAFVDDALTSLIRGRLIKSSVTDALLAPDGILGGLSSRAKAAYCLGLLHKAYFQDICLIAQIRNRFAHHHLQLSFGDASVQQLCSSLGAWRVPHVEQESSEPTTEELQATARNQFNITVALLVSRVLVDALSCR